MQFRGGNAWWFDMKTMGHKRAFIENDADMFIGLALVIRSRRVI